MIEVLKFVTGEDVLAKVSTLQDAATGETSLVLNKPLRFIVTREGPALAPVCPLMEDSQENLVVKHEHIVYRGPARQEVADAYNTQTGSVIQPNGTSGLVLP